MHCENKIFLNACMTEMEWLTPCPRMDMNELVCLLGKHEKYESLLDETWNVMPIGRLTDLF